MANGTPAAAVTDMDFIFLLKYTAKGIESLAGSSQRNATTSEYVLKQLQARCGFISTTGPYDMVSFFQGTDMQAHEFSLWLRSLGTLEVDTLKIQTRSMEDYRALLQRLFADPAAKARR
jgi:uncharacterized protein with GYD domain